MVRSVRRYAYWFLGVAVAVAWLTPPTEAKEPNPIVQLAKKLAEPVDFPGFDDPKTTLEEASAWASHTTGPFDLQVFRGGHFFLTDHADQIIKILHGHFHARATSSHL